MAVLAGSLASAAAAFFTSSIAKNLGHSPSRDEVLAYFGHYQREAITRKGQAS